MPIDLNKFENTDKKDGVAIYQRDVKTPMPEEDESGYTIEEHTQTAYKTGNKIILLRQVSNNGWSVWEYTEADSEIVSARRIKMGISEQQAQRLGRAELLEE